MTKVNEQDKRTNRKQSVLMTEVNTANVFPSRLESEGMGGWGAARHSTAPWEQTVLSRRTRSDTDIFSPGTDRTVCDVGVHAHRES